MEISNIILFNISKAGNERSITFQWKTKCYHFVFIGFKLVRKTAREYGLANRAIEEAKKYPPIFEEKTFYLDENKEYPVIMDVPK